VWLVLVAACSGHPNEPSHPRGSGAHPDARVAVATAPSARECEDLITHAVTLHMAALREKYSAEQLPTEADQATLVAELRRDPGCRALSRDAYRCALAALSIDEIEACRQSTPSSSTSNSSVAPGGMTPPAPRSP